MSVTAVRAFHSTALSHSPFKKQHAVERVLDFSKNLIGRIGLPHFSVAESHDLINALIEVLETGVLPLPSSALYVALDSDYPGRFAHFSEDIKKIGPHHGSMLFGGKPVLPVAAHIQSATGEKLIADLQNLLRL